jgi:hypothetical protein
MRCAAAVLVVSVLEGCIALPIPHDRPYSPVLSGSVIDAQTSKPIAGATLRLEATTLATHLVKTIETDVDGRFSVVITKREFWMPMWLGPGEGTCTATATVSAPGFVAQTKNFSNGLAGASGLGVCHRYTELWPVSLAKGGT